MDKYLTVSAITHYLKFKFDTDDNLKVVYLKGEISNFKAHTTGHYYFSLKDETSKINAIMFASNTKKLNFFPKEGMKVLVVGRISIFEATGNYQIYVDTMIEDGVGNLYVAFEKLKEELAKEGLFDPEHKKSIPKIPKTVGIVTAPTGAAIRDILSTIQRRFPIARTILFPSLVQGELAAKDIVKNIELANTYPIDVLIVGRGGGSIEDLWPFNEEIVARAIYNSKVPVVSAVGHEIDFTIADFVADLRAPTPTGAAEMVVPNIVDVTKNLNQLKIRLNEAILKKVRMNALYLESLKNSFVIKSPIIMFENQKQRLDLLAEKINTVINYNLNQKRVELNHLRNNYILVNPKNLYQNKENDLVNLIEKLELINPLAVLKRGYNILYKDDKLVKSIKNLKVNDTLIIKMNDGLVTTQITKIKED